MQFAHATQRRVPKVLLLSLLSLLLAFALLFASASYAQKQSTTRKRPAPISNASLTVPADVPDKIAELIRRENKGVAEVREIKNLIIANPGLINWHAPNSWSMLHASFFLYFNILAKEKVDVEAANAAAELIHFLVNKGANVEYKDNKGNPARDLSLADGPGEEKTSIALLRASAASGDIRSLKVLFVLGADLNLTTEGKDTPLMAAARNREIEAVKLLLAHGANASLKNDDGATARSMAIDNGDAEIAKLLTPGAKLPLSAKAGLRSATAIPAEVDAKLKDIFGRAEKIGADEIREIRNLVAAYPPLINYRFGGSGSMLHIAATLYMFNFFSPEGDEEKGDADAELIQLLVSKGANLKYTNKDGKTALDIVLDKEGYEDGGTTLHKAAARGDTRTAKVLFALGANANPMTKNGYTPLMFAASQGHIEIVKLLLAHGANPLLKSGEGITAINNAIDGGHTEIVKLLSSAKPQMRKK